MLFTSIVIPVLTLVVIFLFGIQKFTNQIDKIAGDDFKRILAKLTKTPLHGTVLGTVFTALIQSSTATTVILISLVDKGIISFSSSLGVMFGANIGTTITSQLVALQVTNIAPYFVLLGFFVTYFGGKFRHLGKPIFYFGLTFFSLSLISLYVEPIKADPDVMALFAGITNLYAAILAGIIFTIILQFSGVVAGLSVLLVSAGLMTLEQAVGIMFGANIGTTATALIASLSTNLNARKAAMAHFLFNVLGVVIFLPFVEPFIQFVTSLGGSAGQAVANAHVLFNVITVGVFLVFLRPFERLINALVTRRAAR